MEPIETIVKRAIHDLWAEAQSMGCGSRNLIELGETELIFSDPDDGLILCFTWQWLITTVETASIRGKIFLNFADAAIAERAYPVQGWDRARSAEAIDQLLWDYDMISGSD